ncbi:hypothetical protein [Flavobacterium covae]
MEKWNPLNMELRSWVINKVLRLEQTSSSALRTIFRIFNENSKTLGNKSSALSFKSKIDLLLDLEEITYTEYNHLIKLMEIRNQFAHNPNATSFESLDNINLDINKYLLKFENEKADKTKAKEERLKIIFNELFRLTAGKLIVIEFEYSKGMEKEMRKHLNDKIVENINDIWQNALSKNKDKKSEMPTISFINNCKKEIEYFYSDFKIAMNEFAQSELKVIEGDKLKTVFKQKMTSEEILKNIDQEENNK